MKLGFKKALLVSSSVLLTLSVGITNYIAYSNERDSLTELIADATTKRAKSESKKVQDFMESIGRSVHGMAEDYRQNTTNAPDDVSRLMAMGRASNIDILTVGYSDNTAYTNDLNVDGWDLGKAPESYKPAESFWYKDARAASGTIYTDIYVDTTTDTTMVSVAEKIPNGALIADITLDKLNDIVDSIDIEGAKAFILDQNSAVLASNHPDIKNTSILLENGNFKQLAQDITRNNTLATEYEINDVDKALFSHQIDIGDKKWFLSIELDKSTAFAKLAEVRNRAIIATIVSLIISLILYTLILNYVYRPIPLLKKTINGLSQGTIDLTQRLEVNGHDDLADISSGVNQFIANFQQMMRDIQEASNQMQENMVRLRDRSAENAEFLQNHLSETEQIVAAIEEMNATAESMASDIAHTAEITQQASDTSMESRETTEQAQSTVTALISEVTQSSENVQKMNDETENINSILTVIGDIAEQTNLLALNAAIEAARAGEQGRGFAVVADEVRNLAGRTKESTAEVEKALESLVARTHSVVESMDITKTRCEETANNAGQVASSLMTMGDFVENINGLSTQVATAAEEQSSVTREVSSNMTAISEIVTELDANGKQALTDAEEIAKINEQLVTIVKRFSI
ncbi:methyl-accepting chemotaxis protein [Vibrio sp. SCSIO 43137]|uniref:methyl-accepting chemotaxis protein n=1 Tax=Vibrio sp. SCSIO 43137 TaxID=3021011 RepID=UPI00230737D4|nr:methyl-accepting chemotaxis protein [Vibrio sp. SCSIO 43137]WCE32041.1 methyl-accepting chemotaxis protein [Vibrio sp. SCSIO 43137]